jgi:superfamily II DNA or RNA helicase
LRWTPRNNYLGPLRKITTSATLRERLAEVAAWDEDGGILILSYDIFRNWIHNRETKNRGKPLDDQAHTQIREQLLKGPSIIVADEAHKMKNRESAIATAASEFQSKRRIALTGSPLANNLVDYFAMVDWIAPGYLGKFLEFKANYVEPIEEGLYIDSSYSDRRRSLKKLQVLKEILDPKINRADISVLKGSLPPKVEFVITVSLTDLQKRAYNMYVTSLLEDKLKSAGTAKIWSWLAVLGLCCNHPACFNNRLKERANNQRKVAKRCDDLDLEEMPGDEPIDQTGLSESMIASQDQLFSSVPDLENPLHSHRAQILDRIISESIKVGDKVLVFSHSLATLDYLESLLISSNRRYSRLDGSTPVGTRQAATKNFNSSETAQQVFLISTRAGGLGLNIPGANRVVIYDFLFNPTWEEQAVGRAYRLGQQKPVFVYRFIAGGTFEEVLHNKAIFKTQLAIRVVDKKNPVRWASKSLVEYLFPVKEVKEKDISEYVGKDPHVLDKIIQDDELRAIRKIDLTETFQREDNDKLTEEEKKDVQEELDVERLKRTDPEAYARKMRERYMAGETSRLTAEAARLTSSQPAPPSLPMGHGPSLVYPYPSTSGSSTTSSTPVIPNSAHNTGPRPLQPDTTFMMNSHSERASPAEGGNTAATLSSISEMVNASTISSSGTSQVGSSRSTSADQAESGGLLERHLVTLSSAT